MTYLFRLKTGHDSQGTNYYQRLDTNGSVSNITQADFDNKTPTVNGQSWSIKSGDWNGTASQVASIPTIFDGMGIRDATYMNGHGHQWETYESSSGGGSGGGGSGGGSGGGEEEEPSSTSIEGEGTIINEVFILNTVVPK